MKCLNVRRAPGCLRNLHGEVMWLVSGEQQEMRPEGNEVSDYALSTIIWDLTLTLMERKATGGGWGANTMT